MPKTDVEQADDEDARHLLLADLEAIRLQEETSGLHNSAVNIDPPIGRVLDGRLDIFGAVLNGLLDPLIGSFPGSIQFVERLVWLESTHRWPISFVLLVALDGEEPKEPDRCGRHVRAT